MMKTGGVGQHGPNRSQLPTLGGARVSEILDQPRGASLILGTGQGLTCSSHWGLWFFSCTMSSSRLCSWRCKMCHKKD